MIDDTQADDTQIDDTQIESSDFGTFLDSVSDSVPCGFGVDDSLFLQLNGL